MIAYLMRTVFFGFEILENKVKKKTLTNNTYQQTLMHLIQK